MERSFRARTIDLHAHLTPLTLLHAKSAGRSLHGIDPEAIARGALREIAIDERIADMDRLGVDVQVVSVEPQMYCYQYPADSAAAVHREVNDEVRQLMAARPDRFRGLAIVPMQDVRLAVAELERAMAAGFSGAMIGDHVGGVLYDDPRFAPFWKAAQEARALVLLHQASPTLVQTRIDRYHLGNTVGNAVERTLSFASLVFGGVLDRHPELRFALAHAGGYSVFAAGRMDWGWRWRSEARETVLRPPTEYLRRFHYDCITHSEGALRFLVDEVGSDRIAFGTDYPGYAAGREGAGYQPRDWLTGLTRITDDEKRAILGGTLAPLLGA